ncbi:MAG: hypothetical protein ABR936_17390 [Bacteroidota bacterium]|jgi:hypothetical protein
MTAWIESELNKLRDTAKQKVREWIVEGIAAILLFVLYVFRDYVLHLIKAILTKPIISWHIEEVLFATTYQIIVFSFMFLLGKRINKSFRNPTITQPIQPINKEVHTSKPEPEKSIQREKFYTFDGVTFKYDSISGMLFDGYYCSVHHVPMKVRESRALGRREATIYCKCRVCKEEFHRLDVILNEIRTSFQVIVKSYVIGDLKELPTEPEEHIAEREIKTKETKLSKEQISLLNHLSGGEKNILNRYFVEDHKTISFPLFIKDMDRARLVEINILFNSTEPFMDMVIGTKLGVSKPEALFTINELAWQYLKDNPQLLK